MSKLLSPVELGDLKLANRVVMAPMTRSRATADHVPTDIMVDYYAQRASAGLIVAEGTATSAVGTGYCRTPGIYSEEQIAAWAKVTQAVHAAGGKIVLQLMHVGRVATHYNKPEGAETVAPSPVQAEIKLFTDSQGMVAPDVPRELSTAEVQSVIDEHVTAAQNARRAGFDGVELHCTSGYLPMQFMASGSNQRSDQYGGSVENRVRFPAEIISAMAQAIGAGRVGYRMRLGNPFNDIKDEDPVATAVALMKAVSHLDLAYLHMMNPHKPGLDVFELAKEHANTQLILNDSFDLSQAKAAMENGVGSAVSFGRYFIANPDLVSRFANDHVLADFDKSNVYTPGPAGYTDYPAFS
ncbi:alkene reductase [uncultured Marinobacter sp.]|uniref:alkene reductase n=1 Tax=uncultured Marinobacter sp. TaxID=187379 RepID=UPI0026172EA6|nr:alkene reductase [uncultured Marinobacter sp.]